jgi:hypothetical protein
MPRRSRQALLTSAIFSLPVGTWGRRYRNGTAGERIDARPRERSADAANRGAVTAGTGWLTPLTRANTSPGTLLGLEVGVGVGTNPTVP